MVGVALESGDYAKDAVLHCAHDHPNKKVEPGEPRYTITTPALTGAIPVQTPAELRQRPGLTGAPPGKYSNV
ncbi:hypothetical protein DPMN_133318 [Dreissena polymorpha]|uniref:Uncharacterized protein n=1 Tax=Dreissena polymorpha TaxID=45954 RepID=A0A9D4JAV3_DREPO|nr:hypothetical protein DPMN_133318 [Dreissena polymorpha]